LAFRYRYGRQIKIKVVLVGNLTLGGSRGPRHSTEFPQRVLE
jgi:hypothetical protein